MCPSGKKATNSCRVLPWPCSAFGTERVAWEIFTRGQVDTRQLLPSALGIHRDIFTIRPFIELLDSALMSHSQPTTSLSSQSTINDALKAYQRRTKKDLLSHPLASQIQACNSPGDILTVLQQQIQGLGQSQSADERWTRWLNPTINVISAFSQTVGTVGLV